MNADLKALKSMFGMCGATNTIYLCIYCMAGGMGKADWMAESEIGKSPSRHLVDLSRYPMIEMIWNPILPIEFKNVHICTLHDEIRILDKLHLKHI